jgi:hypothetical protein
VVVPRYSTKGIVVRFLIRRLISYGLLFYVLRLLGMDIYEEGGWTYVALTLFLWYVVGIGDLVRSLLNNRDLRRALDENQDPEFLLDAWRKRDTKFHRLSSIPVAVVGIAVLAGAVRLPTLEIPLWLGIFLLGFAAAMALFPKRFVEKRPIESMVTHVLPPGISKSE